MPPVPCNCMIASPLITAQYTIQYEARRRAFSSRQRLVSAPKCPLFSVLLRRWHGWCISTGHTWSTRSMQVCIIRNASSAAPIDLNKARSPEAISLTLYLYLAPVYRTQKSHFHTVTTAHGVTAAGDRGSFKKIGLNLRSKWSHYAISLSIEFYVNKRTSLTVAKNNEWSAVAPSCRIQ